ncbi:MAG TPA: cytochrome ubiquinol oxidase subunit I [Candidatus Omnitrophota bacterium]|nr:cytochrome ubiquinol oxidase subunit I [Candidatus Omnitrophota bacterium]
MSELGVVELSRLQFALTALYHFLFVPLTLGLSWLLAIMESVWVMTGREVWRDMTRFWGKLFGINFAMGVATGITMEFQFGTNWAYYSHFVGDIFGAPLALEGLTAFFLESTFVGLFFFGWERLKPRTHLLVTWLVALGSSLSAMWILVANAWMQAPVGAAFNPATMRMELTSLGEVFFNPVAQAKFVHTVSAGYVTGAMFVLSISAYYLLRRRHVDFAKRSFAVAAAFGMASALSVVVLGDESGYVATENQKMKIAAMEGMFETEPAPAPFTLFGIPDEEAGETHAAIRVPWALGLIATRSASEQLPGIKDLVAVNEGRVRAGIAAFDAIQTLRANPGDAAARAVLEKEGHHLGYGLLLRRYVEDPRQATPEQIAQAARDTVPGVAPLFWTFRIMVALGFWFILLFALALWASTKREFDKRWLLWLALLSLPLPWVAAEVGWFVAEYGRQPWTIEGVLPTFLSTSSVGTTQVWTSLSAFVVFYTALLVVDLYLMVKYARLGPAAMPEPPAADKRRASAQALMTED